MTKMDDLKDFDVIAQWCDGDDYSVTFLCENFPLCSGDVMKEIFEHKMVGYEWAGFFCGIHPSKYQLMYGVRKDRVLKYKKELYNEAEAEMREKFEDYAEEFEIFISKKSQDYRDLINNQKIVKWVK